MRVVHVARRQMIHTCTIHIVIGAPTPAVKPPAVPRAAIMDRSTTRYGSPRHRWRQGHRAGAHALRCARAYAKGESSARCASLVAYPLSILEHFGVQHHQRPATLVHAHWQGFGGTCCGPSMCRPAGSLGCRPSALPRPPPSARSCAAPSVPPTFPLCGTCQVSHELKFRRSHVTTSSALTLNQAPARVTVAKGGVRSMAQYDGRGRNITVDTADSRASLVPTLSRIEVWCQPRRSAS